MRLLRRWDTIEAKLQEFALPPTLDKVAHWVARHPQALLAGAVVILMAVALAQSPSEAGPESDPYGSEVPLFV